MNNFKSSNFVIVCTLFIAISFSCNNEKPNVTKDFTETKSNTYKQIEKYPNGNIKIKGDIVNGIKQGKWESFYENGNKWSECKYLFGRRDGIYRTFYSNGNPKIHGIYKDDKKVDVWFFYNENGQFEKEVDFNKNENP